MANSINGFGRAQGTWQGRAHIPLPGHPRGGPRRSPMVVLRTHARHLHNSYPPEHPLLHLTTKPLHNHGTRPETMQATYLTHTLTTLTQTVPAKHSEHGHGKKQLLS